MRLAECWLTGYGCEVNINRFWYAANNAYSNGSRDICLILGQVFKDGKICPKDLNKAKNYFEEGARRGNELCEKALNDMK